MRVLLRRRSKGITNPMMDDLDVEPWYRQFWPWFIMALPAASVVAGLWTFFLAGGEPSMVVDDYGRIAMATAQRAERAERATELGISAQLKFYGGMGPATQAVDITLDRRTTADVDWPDSLVLQLIHPTRAELDREISLAGSRGRYSGSFARPEGRFYVSLSDAFGTWRLTGEISRHADSLTLVADGVTE